ncbi:unnamed protein product [Allacma fusca]|uniref:Dipeptidase n=1 Tax=Allacma fusca TaxID=39272 RepID=A0A8J2P369_9HEXA|nr:unnamed protein product [Allacma fusca]
MNVEKAILIIAASALLVATVLMTVNVLVNQLDNRKLSLEQRVQTILDNQPIIDGHNDLPWNIRNLAYNDLRRINLASDLSKHEIWGKVNTSYTDFPRLRKGRVGALFWGAYTDCSSQLKDSVEQTLEQIDLIKRLVKKYPNYLEFAFSAADIENAIENKKIASLIGIEGGHSIQFSFGILRMFYSMGARYMTLTHDCNTPWVDASPVDPSSVDKNPTLLPQNDGISEFGLRIVKEMNRLGMMIDISHVSQRAMEKALKHSVAPVIFSHSSARAICDHHRNVPDSVLRLVKKTNSIVMVTFSSAVVRCDGTRGNVSDVVKHIQHIRSITGPEHIGLGGAYDGGDVFPKGLEDCSKYPNLFKALLKTGDWTVEDLEKLAGKNILRVFQAVEQKRNELKDQEMEQGFINGEELDKKKVNLTCITANFER